jgi:cell division initiation protein
LRISPLNIKNQEFNKSLRGYDKDEVRDFLEKLAGEYEDVARENEHFRKELEEARIQLAEFKRIEKNLQETLLRAQESSSKSVESAKKQTALMVKEAEIKSEQMIEKARAEAEYIRGSLVKLKEERGLIIAKLKSIIASQSTLLEMSFNKKEKNKETPKEEMTEDFKIDINDIVDKLL